MLTISELYSYPIKSLGGVALSHAAVTDRGFEYDRRWMLIDEHNRFLTQREYPHMALLNVEITEAGLLVRHPDKGHVIVPFKPALQVELPVQVWNDTCIGILVNPDLDSWFSDALGITCSLVFMPETTHRQVDQRYAPDGFITSFADGYPFLMIGQASLDDLNSRMEEPLNMDRFRPNMVFTGGNPFEEDLMKHIQLSNIDFYGVKRCARCVVTTINQQTAKKAKEPLKTLASYRSKNKKILFGQNLIHQGTGVVRIGDTMQVLSTHTEDRFMMP
ncbi:MOSC domain-containing protein [Parapedobacter tibetensis]|uniref:MOSC domain-containing protein n=1 Tax=Parapedobacter tibetensis TaxID=2972951 RepID=UPI00214D81B7|nr:MOSC N-terminal beta barrel domain-containing protein [Parapedobacter tibetensis]